MLSSTDIGANLMNAVAKGTSVSFPAPYLGLFTIAPGADMSGGHEVDYPEYARVQLNVNGIEGKAILTTPYVENGTDEDGDTVKVTKVKNQEEIHFPENQTGGEMLAVAWGLFSSRTAQKPYMAGKLKANVTIRPNSIPMVRVNNLVLGVK